MVMVVMVFFVGNVSSAKATTTDAIGLFELQGVINWVNTNAHDLNFVEVIQKGVPVTLPTCNDQIDVLRASVLQQPAAQAAHGDQYDTIDHSVVTLYSEPARVAMTTGYTDANRNSYRAVLSVRCLPVYLQATP